MRHFFQSTLFTALLTILVSVLPSASAIRYLETKSLRPCKENPSFTASRFNVIFTPNNGSLAFDIVGVSTISGKVTAELEVFAYGISVYKTTLDPCTEGWQGACPMNPGPITIPPFNQPIGMENVKRVPGIAYSVPDLDGLVRVNINHTESGQNVGCVEAELSNGKTVDLAVISWVTAVIAGLALIASAVTSGLGHLNTAAHVAANALSLFGFFQSQAIIGMTAVSLPPVVMAWTQNFQWSMGIIGVGFLQDITTWYQRATGGTPSTLLSTLTTASVQVQKRSIDAMHMLFLQAYEHLTKRATDDVDTTNVVTVQGITRVGFRSEIERTNIFLTGLIFFMVFVVFTATGVALFKGFCEAAVKAGWFKGNKFEEFRTGWKIVLKGILFRLVLIGYPQICVLCLWELTQRDSAAEVILALCFFVSMTVALVWAALKVVRIAKRSVNLHKNPAYILFSDPAALNKWGFLYVQFRATAYYFIIPLLLYILIKSLFIAFAQKNGTVQAIALLIIEAVFLIGVCILRPWMDKKTNAFNISIAAINFLNVIFLLVFTSIFNQPGIVTGVMGVLFFVVNVLFATVLLIMVLLATGFAIFMKNPDTRYQPMRDDRGSFIKSATQLNTELDALGATARGDMVQTPYNKARHLDDDDDSFSTDSGKHQQDAAGIPLPPSTANSNGSRSQRRNSREPPRSPIDSSMPFLPTDGGPRHGEPVYYSEASLGMYNGYNESSRPGANFSHMNQSNSHFASSGQERPTFGRSGSSHSHSAYRQQNNTSPWQRGAGYDH